MEDDHTASFLSALANLQPAAGGSLGDATPPVLPDDEISALDGWSIDQLKAEVVRLRRALAFRDPTARALRGEDVIDHHHHHHHHHPATADAILHSHLAFAAAQQQYVPVPVQTVPPVQVPVPVSPPAPVSLAAAAAAVSLPTATPSASTSTRKRSAALADDENDDTPRKATKRDEGTGKRVERGRRVELGRAIRTKMRMAMNIGMDDPLPPPTAVTVPDARRGDGYWVPNWMTGLGDPVNSQWLDRVCLTFIAEARAFQGWAKVPPEDLEEELVKSAARTAFMNFAKRYLADVDPKHAKRKEKYVKNRRRWARKDLKQKRRSKAALDPSFGDILPASALHIDYMSSEYSSAGEDDPEEVSRLVDDPDAPLPDQRRSQWLEVLHAQTPDLSKTSSNSGKGGWADGVSEKVLEVRKPTWRSARLEDIYQRLDTISAAQAALRATPASHQVASASGATSGASTTAAATTTTKPPSLRLGHVAPSHRRFVMPLTLMRRGRRPKDTGEAWMWASGQAGVWPASEREVVQAVDAVAAVASAANGDGVGVSMGVGVDVDVDVGVDVGHGHGHGHGHVNVNVDVNAELEAIRARGVEGVHVGVDVGHLEEDLDPSVDALVEGWTEVEG